MKLKVRSLLIIATLMTLTMIGGVSSFVLPQLLSDPAMPPPLLTAEELAGMQLLFDGKATQGWTIDGPSAIEDGTLQLGGDAAATARLMREFDPGDRIQFHFFHERTAPTSTPQDTVMRMELTYRDPRDRHVGQQGPYDVELRASGLTPIGGDNVWHKGVVQTGYEPRQERGPLDFRWQVRLYQFLNRDYGPSHSGVLSTDDGCRFVMVFQTAPGNRLLLRNLCVKEASQE